MKSCFQAENIALKDLEQLRKVQIQGAGFIFQS